MKLSREYQKKKKEQVKFNSLNFWYQIKGSMQSQVECKVKHTLGSITMNKASVGDGIPIELFQILKDDAVKVLHSICQQIWKTQQ